MGKLTRVSLILLAGLVLVLPMVVFGRIGVGVGVGKIQVDKPLKAGMIYDLPSLPVLNTGDEPGEYGVSLEYHEGQETNPEMGLKPAKEWFSFEPTSFHLEPGQVQQVKITLTLPTKTVPGNYFAYLEGHPVKKAESGQTRVGVAAAAKLYFTVAPANIFQGIYYRFISLYRKYHPWDTIILVLIVLAIAIRLIGKRFKIQIARK
ncbi:MAG: hypothetical protein ACPLW9_00505 [Minisyncoccales bacterium]